MIDYVLLALLVVLAVLEYLDGRLIHRLDERCVRVSHARSVDQGLLRWYVQGFDRPLRMARWLVRASAALLLSALLLTNTPALIAATILVLAISVYELRFGASLARRHLQTVRIDQRSP